MADDLTPIQDLIIKACLADSKTDQQKWVAEWEEKVIIHDLDYSSSRLIPYFFHRNQASDITTKHDNRLKIIYKHWWLRTQHITDQLNKVQAALREANVAYVLIKGAAIRNYYKQHELRPMADFDILVRPEMLDETLDTLTALGFVPNLNTAQCLKEARGMMMDFMHGIECAHHTMDVRVDIHWRIGSFCSLAFTEKLWSNLDEYPLFPGAKQPRLPYEVFMLLMHAAVNKSMDNLNWIIDMVVINANSDQSFWKEAREIAIEEKKESIFDYACTILTKYGVYAPPPVGAVRPPILHPMTKEQSRQMGFTRLYRTKVNNLRFQVRNLFPQAGTTSLVYHYCRRVRFHLMLRRIVK
jgi:uncharacterized membrane protein YbaN (DUF454 family)